MDASGFDLNSLVSEVKQHIRGLNVAGSEALAVGFEHCVYEYAAAFARWNDGTFSDEVLGQDAMQRYQKYWRQNPSGLAILLATYEFTVMPLETYNAVQHSMEQLMIEAIEIGDAVMTAAQGMVLPDVAGFALLGQQVFGETFKITDFMGKGK